MSHKTELYRYIQETENKIDNSSKKNKVDKSEEIHDWGTVFDNRLAQCYLPYLQMS